MEHQYQSNKGISISFKAYGVQKLLNTICNLLIPFVKMTLILSINNNKPEVKKFRVKAQKTIINSHILKIILVGMISCVLCSIF